jgi:hypothetical protein
MAGGVAQVVECLPSKHEAQYSRKKENNIYIHARNPSTQKAGKAEAGRARVQSQPGLQSKIQNQKKKNGKLKSYQVKI